MDLDAPALMVQLGVKPISANEAEVVGCVLGVEHTVLGFVLLVDCQSIQEVENHLHSVFTINNRTFYFLGVLKIFSLFC